MRFSRGGSRAQNRLVVVLGIIGIAAALTAFVGPWWVDSAVQADPIATWQFGPFGMTYTLPASPSPPEGAYRSSAGQEDYSAMPHLGSVFFLGAAFAAAGIVSWAGMIVSLVVFPAKRHVERMGFALGLLSFLLLLAAALQVMLLLPAMANVDWFPYPFRAAGFWGSAPSTSGQWGDYREVWGAGWAWYSLLLAATFFLIAGVCSLRARKESASPGRGRVPEPRTSILPSEPGRKQAVGIATMVIAMVLLGILAFVAVYQSMSGGTTSLPPFIRLGAPIASGLGEQIPVTAAYNVRSTDLFRVNLAVNGVYGVPATLPTLGGGSVIVSAGDSYYRVNWTDRDGHGTITVGDSFQVTRTDQTGGSYVPLPARSEFRFYLIRSDGASDGPAVFSTP